jgi:cell division protein FtsQ
MMKKWIKIVLWVLLVAAALAVLIIANYTNQAKKSRVPFMSIHVEGENAFITEAELLKRVEDKHLFKPNQSVESLNVRNIERFIEAMEEVKSVKVYKNIGAAWFIEVELRKPIARIFKTNNKSYYIDDEGNTLGRSNLHTARVLVFSGYINENLDRVKVAEIINNDSLKSIRKIDDIYRISDYVCNDPLLHVLIGQVYLEKNGDFILTPLVGDQIIIFGSANTDEEVKDKFERLKIFYKEAMPYVGWDKYKEITVKYEGQIVGRKK